MPAAHFLPNARPGEGVCFPATAAPTRNRQAPGRYSTAKPASSTGTCPSK